MTRRRAGERGKGGKGERGGDGEIGRQMTTHPYAKHRFFNLPFKILPVYPLFESWAGYITNGFMQRVQSVDECE